MGMNEVDAVSEAAQVKLGRLPLKTTLRALQFSEFFRFAKFPPKQMYWEQRSPLPLRTFGNTEVGDCTRAKQAMAILRMERQEQKRTIEITDEEVKRVYFAMTARLYGGGDTGAYEDDALKEWRNPDTTIRDTKGNPLTIDGFLRINALDHDELRAALALSGPKCVAFCINLPIAFSRMDVWDLPEGTKLVGEWMPGSWGGHSMLARAYTGVGPEDFMVADSTWGKKEHRITWRAAAAYVDEAHMFIDSVDAWRKKTEAAEVRKALGDFADAVNGISDIRIALA